MGSLPSSPRKLGILAASEAAQKDYMHAAQNQTKRRVHLAKMPPAAFAGSFFISLSGGI